MKKILFVAILMLVSAFVFAQKPTKLKIIYFHSERRCPTCISIEENTKTTLNTYFASKLKDGTITFEVLNSGADKNRKMVEKYQADGSSLFLTKVEGTQKKNHRFNNLSF